MKDYAKVINQSKEIHGREQGRQTLTRSAMQKSRTTSAKEAPKKSGSGFFALVTIFIVVAILFAVYRQYTHHKKAEEATAQPAGAKTSQQVASNPQFDFYSVLPNGASPSGAPTSSTTVQAGGAEAAPAPAVASAPVAVSTAVAPVQTINTAPTQFYLNAGEFANKADAQQMLSQLLLLGTQANIKAVQDNGAPSYQVLVGPFVDRDSMSIVKNQLQAHQIQASVVQQ